MFSHSSTPQPSPAQAPPLAPHVHADIANFYLQRFDSHVGDLIHSAVYRLVHLGLESGRHVDAAADAELKQKFEAVGTAMQQHIDDAKGLSKRISAADTPERKVALLQTAVQPLLAEIEETGNRGAALNRILIANVEKATGHTLSCDRPNLENSLSGFREGIAGLAYFNHRDIETIDLNSAVSKFRHFCSDFSPSRAQPSASIVAHDLRFALSRFFSLLHTERHQAVVAALEDYAKGGRLFRELDFDLEGSSARQLIDGAFLNRNDGTLDVASNGTVTYRLAVPTVLIPYMEKAASRMKAELAPAIELLQSQRSPAQFEFSSARGVLSFSIQPLSRTNLFSPALGLLHGEMEREERMSPPGPAMGYVALRRECALPDGKSIVYDATMQGAAFLSEAAWRQVAATLRHADQFIAASSRFRAVDLKAMGTEVSILEAYEQGVFEIDLRAKPLYPMLGPGRGDSIAERSWELEYPWQKTKTHPLDRHRVKEPWGHGFENSGAVAVQFGAPEFAMAPLRAGAAKVCALATPIQFSVRHDQEEEVQGRAERYNPLLGSLIRDLEKVLTQVHAKYPQESLSFMLTNIVAFRTAQIGTFDGIYSLNVYGNERRLIALGEFKRSTQSFDWMELNPAAEREGTARIEKVLEQFRSRKRVGLEELEDALLDAKIRIPRSAISGLSDAMSGISHDRYFGPAAPGSIVERLFRRPDLIVELTADRLTITRRPGETE